MTHWEIKTFLEIVKYRSISKAAEKLFLTQSTVSHRLNVLEEELGVKLIIRRKGYRSIELTNDGEAFLPLAYEYEALWERIAVFSQSGSKAVFSIGCHDSMNDSIFYKLLTRLMEASATSKRRMTFRLESHNTEELYQLLESGHINMAFLRNPQENRNFTIEPFFAEEFRLIVTQDSVYPNEKIQLNILDKKKEIDLSSSWGADFMRWHEEMMGAEWMADIAINAASTIPKYLTEADQWAIVPVSVAEELVHSSSLRALEMKTPPPAIYCYKACLKSQTKIKSEMFELFYRVLDDFMASMPYLRRIRPIRTGGENEEDESCYFSSPT